MLRWLYDKLKARFELKEVENGESKVVLDLDQLLPKPVGFILHGKRHVVKPVSVGKFAEIYEKCVEIDGLAKSKKLLGDKLHAAYIKALGPICPTLTRHDLAHMTSTQQNTFFMFVFKVMSGEAFKMSDIEESSVSEKKN